jgi:hypothetical protein
MPETKSKVVVEHRTLAPATLTAKSIKTTLVLNPDEVISIPPPKASHDASCTSAWPDEP